MNLLATTLFLFVYVVSSNGQLHAVVVSEKSSYQIVVIDVHTGRWKLVATLKGEASSALELGVSVYDAGTRRYCFGTGASSIYCVDLRTNEQTILKSDGIWVNALAAIDKRVLAAVSESSQGPCFVASLTETGAEKIANLPSSWVSAAGGSGLATSSLPPFPKSYWAAAPFSSCSNANNCTTELVEVDLVNSSRSQTAKVCVGGVLTVFTDSQLPLLGHANTLQGK